MFELPGCWFYLYERWKTEVEVFNFLFLSRVCVDKQGVLVLVHSHQCSSSQLQSVDIIYKDAQCVSTSSPKMKPKYLRDECRSSRAPDQIKSRLQPNSEKRTPDHEVYWFYFFFFANTKWELFSHILKAATGCTVHVFFGLLLLRRALYVL